MRSARGILAAYVALLILSLPFTPAVVDGLKAAGLLEAVVAALFAGVAASAGFLLVVKLKIRRLRYYVLLASLLAVLGVLVAFVKTHQERVHFIEYGLLAILAGRVVRSPGRAFLLAAAIGLLDEGVQFLLPMRYFDLRDIAFNAIAAAFGAAFLWLTRRFAPERPRESC